MGIQWGPRGSGYLYLKNIKDEDEVPLSITLVKLSNSSKMLSHIFSITFLQRKKGLLNLVYMIKLGIKPGPAS